MRAIVSESMVIFRRSVAVARIVRREKCSAVLTCSGDPFDLPAGYLASRLARARLYVYLFDDYLHQWKHSPHHQFVTRLAEPFVVRGADGVITPNEFLCNEYQNRYGIEPIVIHNPNDVLEFDGDAVPWPAREGEIRIVYTGTIYHAHYDAFRNLVKAIERLGLRNVKLHVYTGQPRDELEQKLDQENISGPVEIHEHLDAPNVHEAQRRADVLFLPLAFDSSIPEVIKTSSPGKMGEYLASGRPILVHAPADSFVSWYFRKHGCGVVVDQLDTVMLVQAMRRVLEDAELRRTVCENARPRVEADFTAEAARTKFSELLRSARR